ncbi:MAG: hypothetical protein C0627_07865 [Sulfurimonas sp.]|nr:MAG: hypothetical protein C0627_07865 [Sulfurimonas sp.]
MRIEQFLRDYFTEDEHFIIALKTLPATKDKKAYTTHKLLNIEDPNLTKFLGHCYYKNRDEATDIYFTLNSYQNQTTKIQRVENLVTSVKSFYFDIDKEVELLYPKIIELFGEATYKITTSEGKYQLIYKFDKPFKGDFIYFKQLLKGVVYHLHPLDKLFDIARIFRLAGYRNKKPNNNDFLVSIEKNENYYTFEQFEHIAKPFMLVENKPLKKSAQTLPKSKNIKNAAHYSDGDKFEEYKGITKKVNKKYNELLTKYKNDKSTADLAFVKWLRYSKIIQDEETLTLKLFEARGYENLMQKHSYQIEYYIRNILEKSI